MYIRMFFLLSHNYLLVYLLHNTETILFLYTRYTRKYLISFNYRLDSLISDAGVLCGWYY